MYSSTVLCLATVYIIAAMIACNSNSTTGPENKTTDTPAVKVASTSVRPVHWSYKEEGGPGGWGKLTPVYALCDSGKLRSPINLVRHAGKANHDWKLEYKTTKLVIAHNEHVDELINNGHTIQVTTQGENTITYAGKVYHLRQFHFHTPSEHTIDGRHAPMEIHLVHQTDDKSLAVIGVLVQAGSHNINFDQLIKNLPNALGESKTHENVTINISMHIPKNLVAFHYIGSLTTPPCSEDVQWLVLKNPISLSMEQIAAFASRLNKNNRPTQPMYERTLTIEDIPAK